MFLVVARHRATALIDHVVGAIAILRRASLFDAVHQASDSASQVRAAGSQEKEGTGGHRCARSKPKGWRKTIGVTTSAHMRQERVIGLADIVDES